ncbi:hypothetical protein VMCG_10768 [Cytospora schulzeri]|uniref:NADH-ubiquinone oxidoreductase 21kDa subunit N-terminal domain-containing protein n=1 Tax=Cytospora schulzeri TaxID=448051 RepID=A0A423V812_9PEZI|nr:hypothetical protein VMCG_10768 [Valsa malicola]
MASHTSQTQTYIPTKTVQTEYPLIDNDPHFKRVVGYARPSDYAFGAATAAAGPGLLWAMERIAPSYVGRGGFARAMRLCGFIGLCGGFLAFYNRSISMSPRISTTQWKGAVRFYGMSENTREVNLDMHEMVDKVKRGETLYGESRLTPHMQGVAARQSRFSALFSDVVPWFNFVNHSQHGVDTAKYYRQAEKELEAERQAKGQDDIAKLG